MEGNLPFLVCFNLYLRAISKYKPSGGLYLEGRFNGGFFCVMSSRGSYLEGLIFGILRYVGERSQKLVGGNSHKRLGETEKIYNVERGVFEKYNHPQERYLKIYKEKDR